MPEPKRPLKVFLCHAHADRDPVRGLYTRLTQDGVDAWLDKAKLLPGQDWELEIRKAVREADVVVVCLSRQFNQAGFRQKEVRLALDTAMEKPEGEIFIIPVRLEECDILESLRKWHWVDLFDEGGYENLMKALKLRDEQLEKARIKKEEIKKRRLPYFEIPIIQNSELQQDNVNSPSKVKKSRENNPVPQASIKQKPSLKKSKDKRLIKTEYIVAIIGAVATIIAGILSSPLIESWLKPTSMMTATITVTSTFLPLQTSAYTITPSPTTTRSPTSTITLTPLATEITDASGAKMALVPAGEFTMGSDSGDDDEKPVHQVYLDAYYMDVYEVTNVAYNACVIAGACVPPTTSIYLNASHYGIAQYDNYPVAGVGWYQSITYCEWRGGKLPTEAQWEKAARGTDGRTYPWGEEIDCYKSNYLGCIGGPVQVGSYENGKSPYGMYDMAGNVWEWVADWYSDSYYKISFFQNPEGPGIGKYRVLRGGYWSLDKSYMRTADRLEGAPITLYDIGFRCAKSAP